MSNAMWLLLYVVIGLVFAGAMYADEIDGGRDEDKVGGFLLAIVLWLPMVFVVIGMNLRKVEK